MSVEGGTLRMLRIHFAADDLIRTHLTGTLGPIAETVFAFDVFERAGGMIFGGWRQQIRARLDPQLDAIRAAKRTFSLARDLLWLLDRQGTDVLAAEDRRQLSGVLSEFYRIAVAPFWENVRGHLEAERIARGRVVMSGGVEQLLSTLPAKIHWRSPVLELPAEEDRDVHLRGRGLLLSPSLFLREGNAVLLDATRETGRPVLIFSAQPDRGRAAGLWGAARSNRQAIAALVGRTRAAVLTSLSDGCSTGQLAERLGISAAGVSQHASVLREAGLISTHRSRNTVLHTLTPLGAALIGGPELISA
ncbi:ArsR family transcriptional regulator [Pseudonocardiaceae bacterium YIM PH 21723]|nr:ArsR family transcriptional regulator [Pseudonocardiaceae bacterium YIM PH 21723]